MEKILLVLDSEDLRESLIKSLTNYRVDICKPDEAAEALTRLQPDTLVLDLSDDNAIVDSLLARFRLRGKPRVLSILRTAVLMAFRDPDYLLTKDIYPILAKEYGGSRDSVDQAIRRMLRRSWVRRNDNADIWELVFPGCTKCPTNGEFIATVALYLHKKYPSRFQKGVMIVRRMSQ